MLVPLAISLHLIASVIWVGGMFFAYMVLRPVAAELLEPPARLKLWSKIFAKFFFWVWISVITVMLSGYWMIMQTWGNFSMVGLDLKLMHILGWVMVLIFAFVFFVPYKRMNAALASEDYKKAGELLALIRKIVAVNLTLGLTVVVIAGSGRYM